MNYLQGLALAVVTPAVIVTPLPIAKPVPDRCRAMGFHTTSSHGEIRIGDGFRSMGRPELKKLDSIGYGWDGAGAPAPNAKSKHWAARILDEVSISGLKLAHVMACIDGGVTIVLGGSKSVLIECFNTGEITIAKSSGPGTTVADEFIADDAAVREVIEDASGFLS